VVNAVDALNVTSRSVNRAKKGAVQACLNRAYGTNYQLRGKPLEECFSNYYRDQGVAGRICRTIVQTYDDFLEPETKEKVTNAALAQNLIDGMADMISKMQLE
jgi:hypothetical protein